MNNQIRPKFSFYLTSSLFTLLFFILCIVISKNVSLSILLIPIPLFVSLFLPNSQKESIGELFSQVYYSLVQNFGINRKVINELESEGPNQVKKTKQQLGVFIIVALITPILLFAIVFYLVLLGYFK